MDTGFWPGPAGVRGIDVSHYQGMIDWSQVAQAGMAFTFIKATEGVSTFDPHFRINWNGARGEGLLRGAYHFYQPGADPLKQAEHFLSVVPNRPGDLPPALDAEIPGEAREVIEGILTWLYTVERKTGKTPILYTNPGFLAKLGDADFSSFPLWIAEYGVAEPSVPQRRWSFWQFSENGSIPGIQAPVDLDVFKGTLSELRQMAGVAVGG